MFLAPSQLVHFLNHAAWIRINRVVVDWKTLRYRLDETAFIVDEISEASRESALPIRILLRSYQADNRRRVKASRQAGTHRNIGAQANLHAIAEEFQQVVGVI